MSDTATRTARLTREQAQALDVKDTSVALGAGAGCGKTTVLTERFLDELEGADGRPLRSLVALTFTDKAARELRQRIRVRCREKLAAGTNVERWGAILRALEAAPIGTFHEFCVRLLRAHAIELGIDPEFAILDGSIAASLRDQAVRTTLRRGLADRSSSDLISLAVDYGLGQIRSAVEILIASRTAGDLESWSKHTPEQILDRWTSVWETQGRPAVFRSLTPYVRRTRDLLTRIEASHAKLRQRREELLELTSAGEPDQWSLEHLEEIRRLARVDDLREKGVWPAPEVKDAAKAVFAALAKSHRFGPRPNRDQRRAQP